ncbi:type I secretion system permease/ATPase [uncultured Thiohalocapsa sp.]|uniref:type I secretion system permease/ATPase n=1 Tax=uncultured Thiohalocapsa sp. TaxID=768990 RepID=UPI0025CF85F2|nr:ATP-binding cassette domain-containing protein [uncultured Thiohalocapsa sp.]
MFKASLVNPSQTHGQPLEDLKQIRGFVGGRSLIAFIDLPWVPIYIAVLFLFHVWYGVFGVIAVVILAALAVANEASTQVPLARSHNDSVAARNLAASQTRNAEVVEAMGMMQRLRGRWRQVYDGSIILGRALAPIDQLISGWKQFASARTAYTRLDELLADFPARGDPMSLPAPEGRLGVEGLVVLPPGSNKPVVRGLSFELDPGEALGVVGPSGAGKSSLARALLGVWPAASGKVRLDGADLSRWNREELGAHVGYLPQDIELFAGSVAENIARFHDYNPEDYVDAAQRVGVHHLILGLPDHYDTQIGPGGSALSGGQRQRIALARAIYGSPKLVVLDEPNASLDEQGEADLLTSLDRLKQADCTVVLISHRPGILMRMDKLLVMKDGAAAAFGARDEILPRLTGKPQQGVSQLKAQGSAKRGPAAS